MATNYYRPGLGNVGSFQTSGIPWVSSSVDCPASGALVAANVIEFPYVTKRVVVRCDGAATIRVGFSDNGVRAITGVPNYFTLGQNNSLELDIKVSRIYLYGDAGQSQATVVAGLTGIDPKELKTNWSGNSGIG